MILIRVQLLLLFITTISFNVKAQDYSYEWLKTAEGISQNFVNGMKSDSTGNVYIYGNFKDSLAIGDQIINSTGDFDFFLAKYSVDGEIQWIKNSGGTGFDNATSIDIDGKGNIYIAGNFMHSMAFGRDTLYADFYLDNFLIKYSPEGDVEYYKNIGASSKTNEIFIKVLSDSCLILAGSFYGELNFQEINLESQGSSDLFIFKVDETGDLNDYIQTGGQGKIKLNDITIDRLNNIYLVGYFKNSVLFGNDTTTSSGKKDAFILKYSSDLDLEQSKHLSCMFDAEAKKISVNSSGLISVSGIFREELKIEDKTYLSSNGANDIFIVDYDSTVNLVEYRNFGGKMNEKIYTFTTDTKGTKIISGSFKGKIEEEDFILESQNKENDLFIGKIEANNEFSYLIKFGGAYQDYISSVSTGLDSCLYITGGFDNNFCFEIDTTTSENKRDIFLIKLNKCNMPNKSDSILIEQESLEMLTDNLYNECSNSNENEPETSLDNNDLFNSNKEFSIDIFPNPSNGRFTMCLNNPNTENPVKYEIYSFDGRLIFKKTAESLKEKINLQTQSGGSYVLKIVNGNYVFNKTIIITE